MTIRFNSGTPGYAWLSNFHLCEVEYDGVIYPSAEHAYQAAKTIDPHVRAHIAKQSSARDAKREGKRIKLRDDWNAVKLNVMQMICDDKFLRNPDLWSALDLTHECDLVHLSPWDLFWGQDYLGKGANHLGHILMRTRSRLRRLPRD